MPEPQSGESREDFVSRCIPIVLDDNTAEDQDQAVAICNSVWEEAHKGSSTMEHKTFAGLVTKADEEQGIVETVFAVMGNIDSGNDIIHPGAFTKTFAEQGQKVKVLDAHRTDSIMRAIGKPLFFKEVSREEMPAEMLEAFPGVTGGAFARIQMLMDTPEGKGAFIRLREKAIDQWSFGYDALDDDFSTVVEGGKEVNVRNLRTIKLYEISPVLFGMNEATTTLSAKAEDDSIMSPQDKVAARPAENKAVNLSQRVDDVITSFYTKFPDVVNPNHGTALIYWVKQVWDEFLIVEQEGTFGRRLWKISYSAGEDGAINFAEQQDWLEVTVAFIPLSNEPDKSAPPQEAVTKEHDQAEAGPQDAPTSKELLELELLALETQTLEVTQ